LINTEQSRSMILKILRTFPKEFSETKKTNKASTVIYNKSPGEEDASRRVVFNARNQRNGSVSSKTDIWHWQSWRVRSNHSGLTGPPTSKTCLTCKFLPLFIY